MRATKIAGCDRNECPAIYVTDTGTVVAQGKPVHNVDGVTPGPGEIAIELPLDVLREALVGLERHATA